MNCADSKSPWPGLTLGDMQVIDPVRDMKMLKALAVIASELHPAYDRQPETVAGYSKQTCMFAAMCVRDFLVHIGFKDATGRSVAALMRADDRDGKQIHSIGLGVPGQRHTEGKFNGHLVVTVPSLNLLIDPTLYQCDRPAWGGALPGMMALEYDIDPSRPKYYDSSPIAGRDITLPDRTFFIMWLDRPDVKWKRHVDFQRNDRRRAVAQAMIDKFGDWKE